MWSINSNINAMELEPLVIIIIIKIPAMIHCVFTNGHFLNVGVRNSENMLFKLMNKFTSSQL